MTKKELVLVAMLVVCLAALVFSSLSLLSARGEIGVKEAELNKIHNEKIKAYDNQIVGLEEIIVTLQTERDSLNDVKKQIQTVFIREVDSVRVLPFTGKANFFTTETTRLDSIRSRHLGRDNETSI